MPDREKVIKGLEKLRKDLGYGLPDRSNVVMEYLNSLTDAITLLKEHEDLETELTNAMELIHKKNERIKKLLKEQEAREKNRLPYSPDSNVQWT